LHSDFETEKFPVAIFRITAVTYQKGKISGVAGNLQIKGITRKIKISGESCCLPQPGYPFFTRFTINRFDWNIGSERSWLEKKLVDKEIQIQVGIVTK
jgi:polyisoprenoid-binding protein YceI